MVFPFDNEIKLRCVVLISRVKLIEVAPVKNDYYLKEKQYIRPVTNELSIRKIFKVAMHRVISATHSPRIFFKLSW